MPTNTVENRSCLRCTAEFEPKRDWSNFCSPACRLAFHNRMNAEGSVLGPLVKAWTATRHAKEGTEEAKICAWARQQVTEIARTFLDEDEEAGRGSAVDYVRKQMKSGFLYVDRRR